MDLAYSVDMAAGVPAATTTTAATVSTPRQASRRGPPSLHKTAAGRAARQRSRPPAVQPPAGGGDGADGGGYDSEQFSEDESVYSGQAGADDGGAGQKGRRAGAPSAVQAADGEQHAVAELVAVSAHAHDVATQLLYRCVWLGGGAGTNGSNT
jgi:hypothetical protein